jgi:hypothetical protein
VYTNKESATAMIEVAAKYNVEGKIVGHCEESPDTRLTIRTEQGDFEYGG